MSGSGRSKSNSRVRADGSRGLTALLVRLQILILGLGLQHLHPFTAHAVGLRRVATVRRDMDLLAARWDGTLTAPRDEEGGRTWGAVAELGVEHTHSGAIADRMPRVAPPIDTQVAVARTSARARLKEMMNEMREALASRREPGRVCKERDEVPDAVQQFRAETAGPHLAGPARREDASNAAGHSRANDEPVYATTLLADGQRALVGEDISAFVQDDINRHYQQFLFQCIASLRQPDPEPEPAWRPDSPPPPRLGSTISSEDGSSAHADGEDGHDYEQQEQRPSYSTRGFLAPTTDTELMAQVAAGGSAVVRLQRKMDYGSPVSTACSPTGALGGLPASDWHGSDSKSKSDADAEPPIWAEPEDNTVEDKMRELNISREMEIRNMREGDRTSSVTQKLATRRLEERTKSVDAGTYSLPYRPVRGRGGLLGRSQARCRRRRQPYPGVPGVPVSPYSAAAGSEPDGEENSQYLEEGKEHERSYHSAEDFFLAPWEDDQTVRNEYRPEQHLDRGGRIESTSSAAPSSASSGSIGGPPAPADAPADGYAYGPVVSISHHAARSYGIGPYGGGGSSTSAAGPRGRRTP